MSDFRTAIEQARRKLAEAKLGYKIIPKEEIKQAEVQEWVHKSYEFKGFRPPEAGQEAVFFNGELLETGKQIWPPQGRDGIQPGAYLATSGEWIRTKFFERPEDFEELELLFFDLATEAPQKSFDIRELSKLPDEILSSSEFGRMVHEAFLKAKGAQSGNP